MTQVRLLLVATVFFGSLCLRGAAQTANTGVLTNSDIVKLAQAGIGDAVIVQTISQSSHPNFDTSADGLVELKGSGVSDTVIAAMLKAGTAPATGSPTPSAATTNNAAGDRKPLRSIKGGVLDEITLYSAKPIATHVIIRRFSATDADIVNGDTKEETKTMQADGPRMLADAFVARLKELGTYGDIAAVDSTAAAPPDALVISGKFIEMDPGSRAKRYFVGFGSGKSAVAVSGSVTTSDGQLLATFEQRRIGAMGAFGGDSLGKLASDTKSIGEDLAKFINAWATGKNLK